MRISRKQPMEMLTISALDIFASALGVFMLVSILLFPNYLKQPAIEAEQAGARAELAAAADDVVQAREAVADAREERDAAQATLAAAKARLVEAEALAARAAQEPEPQEVGAPAEPATTGEQKVRIAIADLDLVFVVDTTGSMRHELADLQANLIGIIRVLSRLASSLRVGFVAFKDHGEAYLTREYPLQRMNEAHAAELVRFVDGLSASGGGDDPEPVDEALEVALAMPWRTDAKGRIVVIGDAPAHANRQRRTLALAEHFRRSAPGQNAPRSVSAIYTGDSVALRPFFERLAAAGGGDLSDHQGQMIESVLLAVLDDG
ncbi:MAG TPA: VWA domain-containing protein [Geminicoccaceae bacterium]|nr:VWA domain-containing protein [Geminicoccaceae bacterium]